MTESLFTTQTPSVTDGNDGGPAGITSATKLMFAVAGTVSAIRFFATSTVSAPGETYTGQLWEASAANPNTAGVGGAPLASGTLDSGLVVAGAWNVINLSAPVSVVPGKLYVAGSNNSHNQGRYVFTGHFFTAPLVSGNITAPADGATVPGYAGTITNGCFIDSPPGVYPSGNFNANCYFADVVFNPAAAGRVPDLMAFFG